MSIKAPTEKDVLRACRQLLDLRRVFYLRNNSGQLRNEKDRPVRFGTPGSCDLLLCVRGLMVGVEVKSGKGKTTALQEGWMAALREAGGKAFVVRSPDELNAALNELLAP